MLSISELKKIGTLCQINNEPYEVISSQHVQMGRGGAILRLKLKNLITGNMLEKTTKGSETLPEAAITRTKASFLYSDGAGFHFMNNETCEQFNLTAERVNNPKMVKEGMEVTIISFDDRPIAIQLPIKAEFKVVSAPEGVRGNSAQGRVTKTAELETGLEVQVPLFVKEGDIIRVNTENGEYVERA